MVCDVAAFHVAPGSLILINSFLVLKQLGNGLVCDIGSGLGRDLLGVARAYPHLRIELHDKPETMSLARDVGLILHLHATLTGIILTFTYVDVVPPSAPVCYHQGCHVPPA
jgi:hypothetical protein